MQYQPLICPECRTWFEGRAGAPRARCPSCGARFRAEDAVAARGAGVRPSGDESRQPGGDDRAAHRTAAEAGQPSLARAFQPGDAACALPFFVAGAALFLASVPQPGGMLFGLALMAWIAYGAAVTSFWTSYGGLRDWQLLLVRLPRYIVVGTVSLLFFLLQCLPV